MNMTETRQAWQAQTLPFLSLDHQDEQTCILNHNDNPLILSHNKSKEMQLSTNLTTSPFQSETRLFNNLSPTYFLQKSLFLSKPTKTLQNLVSSNPKSNTKTNLTTLKTSTINASLVEAPILWAGRICVYYALLKAGLAGSQANPLVSDLESGGVSVREGGGDLGFSKWLENIRGKPDKELADKRKLVSKWHPTTKGTLRRNYRVPSKSEGRRLLKAIASLLSEDDNFTDATSHKGCQIRRESAHGESVCCNNVRALFDELPTPHLIVEITAFPAGPLTEKDCMKAEKLERVLRSGPSI